MDCEREAMKHPSELTRRQLWVRIVRGFRKTIAELDQLAIDANAFNGMPQMQNRTPFDPESDRIMAYRLKKELVAFLRANPKPPKDLT